MGNLRFGPEKDHIDILASIGEMASIRSGGTGVETVVEGLSISFVSKADLIENKRQAGRLRDLADVEEVELIGDLIADGAPQSGAL